MQPPQRVPRIAACIAALIASAGASLPHGSHAQTPTEPVESTQAPTPETNAETTPAPPPPPPPPPRAPEARPFRAYEALGVPWLRFGLEHRSRFEHLENDFRTANPGDATAFSMRTLLSVELRFLPVVIGAELEDSRAWASDGTPLNSTLIDPMELLQGYVGLRGENVLAHGDAASITVGRMTLDLGSRRLLARNEFRNTINAFTGVDVQWTSPKRDLVRAFAVMPVVRIPSDAPALARNAIRFDRENADAWLFGVFFQSRPLPLRFSLETYVLGLYERDSALSASSDRRLVTPGFRLLRAPAAGELDFQFEAMGQFGRSRASSTATDVTDLDHRAFSLHASIGGRFAVGSAPRIALQYDYASGDRSPGDGVNQRFDPLFGARRFEFGPTGLYGAVARSNLDSPGIRFEIQPHRTFDAFAGYRQVWLASARDAWTTAGLRDTSGGSGRFVGQQVEARLRYHVLPRNLSLELGGALLFRGHFGTGIAGNTGNDPIYVYAQVTGTI